MSVPIQSVREKPQRGSVSSGQSRPRNRQYLPLDKRMKLYRLVIELVERGLTYRRIQSAIFYHEGLRLSKGAISEWARGIHGPSGRVNPFRPRPCPELGYVIGVVLSDGNLNIHGYNAEILLSVTDYDFAEEFSRCLAKILSRRKPYRARRSEQRNRWIVQGSSVLLYRFLNRPWAKAEVMDRALRRMHSRFSQSIL
jgi:intein-encoded DNA endonuclease-like protein